MHAPTIEEAKQYLDILNLDYLIEKMTSESYALPRWTLSDATHCVQLYKNYLLLFKLHPGELLVPTREIDECWHNHILHTKQYHLDCQNIFGFYLHHTPASLHSDPTMLINNFLQTKQYYLDHFQVGMHLVYTE